MDYASVLNESYAFKDVVDYLQMCQFLFWVMIVINLIVLICFFILCSNVSKMKKVMHPQNSFGAMFNFYYSIGDIDKAKELLFREVLNDEYLEAALWTKAEYRQRSQKMLEEKYTPYFNKVGITLDFAKAGKFINEAIK